MSLRYISGSDLAWTDSCVRDVLGCPWAVIELVNVPELLAAGHDLPFVDVGRVYRRSQQFHSFSFDG